MGAGVGNIFYGTEGTLVIDGGSPTFYDAAGKKMEIELDKSGGGDHFTNWVKALSPRRRDDLTAEIEVGHYSSAMCHLPNISYQLGTKQPFIAKKHAFG